MALKLIDPKAKHKLVSLKDDAIDKEKSDTKKFIDDMNIEHLVFLDGKKPWIFHCKNIMSDDFAAINDAHYELDPTPRKDPDTGKDLPPKVKLKDQTKMMHKYFRIGVAEVEIDGVMKKIGSDIEFNQFPADVLSEIGGYLFRMANMGDTEKK